MMVVVHEESEATGSPFIRRTRLLFDSGGPNGALLASLLAVQSGRTILSG